MKNARLTSLAQLEIPYVLHYTLKEKVNSIIWKLVDFKGRLTKTRWINILSQIARILGLLLVRSLGGRMAPGLLLFYLKFLTNPYLTQSNNCHTQTTAKLLLKILSVSLRLQNQMNWLNSSWDNPWTNVSSRTIVSIRKREYFINSPASILTANN